MPQIYEVHRQQFTISTDPLKRDLDAICEFLKRSYWANTRLREKTQHALEHSLVFGVYEGDKQIGLARVITDYSIFAYLCDVFIDETYRSQGLGKWLMQTIMEHPELKDVRRWLLATNDAHGLYKQFGFNIIEDPDRWMQNFKPFPKE